MCDSRSGTSRVVGEAFDVERRLYSPALIGDPSITEVSLMWNHSTNFTFGYKARHRRPESPENTDPHRIAPGRRVAPWRQAMGLCGVIVAVEFTTG